MYRSFYFAVDADQTDQPCGRFVFWRLIDLLFHLRDFVFLRLLFVVAGNLPENVVASSPPTPSRRGWGPRERSRGTRTGGSTRPGEEETEQQHEEEAQVVLLLLLLLLP